MFVCVAESQSKRMKRRERERDKEKTERGIEERENAKELSSANRMGV